MSHGRLQPGHRPQSARRYRGDGESLDQHPYFGGNQSFGGYTGSRSEEPAAPPAHSMPGRADSWMSAGAGAAGATVVGLTTTAGNAWGATGSEDSGQCRPWGAQAQPDGDWTADPQWPRTDEWAAADPGFDDGRGVHYPEGPADYDAAHYDAAGEYDEPTGNEPFNLARLRSSWKRDSAEADEAGTDAEGPRRFSGAHRVPTPPAALKGRAAVVAVAAGAVVAAGQAGMESGSQHHTATADYDAAGQVHEIAAQAVSTQAGNPQSPQVLNVAPVADLSQFQDILQHGQEFAAGLAAQESAKLRPLFSKFANGTFTSGFGSRWGVQHLGVDIAAPIGTPIYAVEDGEVISAGPASGFGMWVRLRHADGTITVYGHVDTATVSEGQHVLAGDQIATVGNRGFSTGPHCHFEVWLNGQDKIDPLPWLASRGISLGPERD